MNLPKLSGLLLLLVATNGYSQTRVVGTTVPVREVQMSFPEAGIIEEIAVEEGESVKQGQLLSKLDTRVLDVALRLAVVKAESQAAEKSAAASWNLRKRRFDELTRLARSGSANKDEVARAEADFEIAEANLDTAREETRSRIIEVEQIRAEIKRRTLLAPFDGVVTRIHREISENFQPGQDAVLTVVQLDELHLVLHFDHRLARQLKTGQLIPVRNAGFGPETNPGAPIMARVVLVSPVTDPASGTTRVKLALDNTKRQHRAGLKYAVDLAEMQETGQMAHR